MLGRLGLALLWLGVAAFAIGSVPRGLANAGNQDQAQTIDNSQGTLGGAFSQTMAQTFQAGITGNLDQVSLKLLHLSGTGDVSVQVQTSAPLKLSVPSGWITTSACSTTDPTRSPA